MLKVLPYSYLIVLNEPDMRALAQLLFFFLIFLFVFPIQASDLISEPPQNAVFEIKQNSSKENIIIRLHEDAQWEYMIFTPDKSCIRMGMLKKGKNKISMKDLCKGEYIVYLSNGEERLIEKVIL